MSPEKKKGRADRAVGGDREGWSTATARDEDAPATGSMPHAAEAEGFDDTAQTGAEEGMSAEEIRHAMEERKPAAKE